MFTFLKPARPVARRAPSIIGSMNTLRSLAAVFSSGADEGPAFPLPLYDARGSVLKPHFAIGWIKIVEGGDTKAPEWVYLMLHGNILAYYAGPDSAAQDRTHPKGWLCLKTATVLAPPLHDPLGENKLARTSASCLSGGLFQRQSVLQAALSLGQPRLISRLGSLARPRFPHIGQAQKTRRHTGHWAPRRLICSSPSSQAARTRPTKGACSVPSCWR